MPEVRKINPNYQPTLFSIVKIVGEGWPDKEFLVNYSDHNTKVWLTKTTIWALTNGRSLSIVRAATKDIESRPLFTPREAAVS